MKIGDFLEDGARILDKTRSVKFLLKPLYRFATRMFSDDYKQTQLKLQRIKKGFDRNALSVLKEFDAVMQAHQIKYTLAAGTMLGAVREHGFIKHDIDIDTFMWIDDRMPDMHNILESAGFYLTHSYSVDNDISGKEDTFEKDNVQIDIFYFYPPILEGNNPYCCDFIPFPGCRSVRQSLRKYGGLLPRRVEVPYSHEIVRIPFEDTMMPVPSNAHEFLAYRYGSDYMIPNPNWSNSENDYIVPWRDKIGIYTEYR